MQSPLHDVESRLAIEQGPYGQTAATIGGPGVDDGNTLAMRSVLIDQKYTCSHRHAGVVARERQVLRSMNCRISCQDFGHRPVEVCLIVLKSDGYGTEETSIPQV